MLQVSNDNKDPSFDILWPSELTCASDKILGLVKHCAVNIFFDDIRGRDLNYKQTVSMIIKDLQSLINDFQDKFNNDDPGLRLKLRQLPVVYEGDEY